MDEVVLGLRLSLMLNRVCLEPGFDLRLTLIAVHLFTGLQIK